MAEQLVRFGPAVEDVAEGGPLEVLDLLERVERAAGAFGAAAGPGRPASPGSSRASTPSLNFAQEALSRPSPPFRTSPSQIELERKRSLPAPPKTWSDPFVVEQRVVAAETGEHVVPGAVGEDVLAGVAAGQRVAAVAAQLDDRDRSGEAVA